MFEKVMESLGDVEKLSSILTSREFYFATKIETDLKLDEQDQDLSWLIDIWNKFYSSIKDVNEENCSLLSYLSSEFKVKFKDSFLIFGTILKHKNYIKNQIGQDHFSKFDNYCASQEKHVNDFRMSFIHYALAKQQEPFFNQIDKIEKEKIKFKKAEKVHNSIYADQNVFSKLIDSDSKSLHIKRNNINLVYSSYLIEDSLNKNPIFMPVYLEKLSYLTNGNMVGYMDEGLTFVTEDIVDTYNRSSSYNDLTKLYENTVFLNKYREHFLYESLRKNGKVSSLISNDIVGFFSGDDKHQLKGYSDIVSEFSQYEDISCFIRSGKFPKVKDIRTSIENLNKLLDFINYETEALSFNNKAKIYSSYRDGQHLQHAYICDFFATDDKRLANRAKLIFELIGVKTKVISMKDMMNIK
ncbi:hypothetical protein ACCI29_004376 [Vibrio parahaemolyticus]